MKYLFCDNIISTILVGVNTIRVGNSTVVIGICTIIAEKIIATAGISAVVV